MRTATCFLFMVLLATVIANASTLTPSDGLVNDFPASLGNGLSRFMGKRNKFPIPAGLGKEVSSPSTATATATASDSTDGSKFEDNDESQKKKGRKYKICLNHGHCYKKKLVCPKKCSSNKSPGELESNNFGGHCVFNCKKCIAHCLLSSD